jgi:hypothetical protein
MRRAGGILALAILLATACGSGSPPAPPAAQPIRPLSPTEPAGNALRIATFVRQQCIEQAGNKRMFEASLRASGWAISEMLVNDSSRQGLVGTYGFPGGFISASFDGRGGNCLMAIDAPLATPIEQLRDALSRFGGRPAPGSRPGTVTWRWSGESGYDYLMDLTPGTATDMARINISTTGPVR